TKGSINGLNEDDDSINEYGYYVQSESRISDKLKFVAAARVDDNSRLPDPVFSPRTGLVFSPDPDNSFRLTFNRAFSTPSALNLFLDLNTRPGVPFNIRLRGVPETGFTFARNSTGLGGLFMQPLFVGAPANSAFLPADATLMWNAAVQVLFLQSGGTINLTALPAPTSAMVGTVLRRLNTTTGGFDDVGPESVIDIDPMKPTINNTIEAGYKGIFGGKFLANVDVYYTKINDFIGPLRVETPNVFLDRASLQAYLENFMPTANAAGIAAGMSGISGDPDNTGIPLGTVTPNETLYPGDLLLTYRNFGDINLTGIDLGFTYYVNRNWNLGGTYSYVSKNLFIEKPQNIALNAPKNKIGASLQYKYPQNGFHAQVRFRWVDGFPVNSGVFIGDVESFGLLDINSGIDLEEGSGIRLTLTIQNLLDNKHREFIGAPEIGRVALVRLGFAY
ncbi:TonB-dependent receptor, partial [candidate division KSB1 bacterium]|nr:TonB-dependent receptor [candidate division KSB1 bacterium]